MNSPFAHVQQAALSYWMKMLFFAVVATSSFTSTAYALEFDWYITSGLRFNYSKNALNYSSYPLTFDENTTAGTILLNVGGNLYLNDYVQLTGSLDIGQFFVGNTNQTGSTTRNFSIILGNHQLNQSADDLKEQQEALKTCQAQAKAQGLNQNVCNVPAFYLNDRFYLSELYAKFNFNKKKSASLRVGMINYNLANALIFDGFGLGGSFLYDLRKGNPKSLPLSFGLDIFLPDASFTSQGKKSPVVNFTVSYALSTEEDSKEKITFFATYMRDGNNLAGSLLLPIWRELFTFKFNEFLKRRSGYDVGLSCFGNADLEKLKASLPPVEKKKQEACEKANVGKSDDEKQYCPVDALADTFYQKTCTSLPESRGNHFWTGLSANKKFGKLTLSGTATMYMSSMTIGFPKVIKPPSITQGNQTRRQKPPSWLNSRFRRPNQGQGTQRRPLVITQNTDTGNDVSINDVNQSALGLSLQFNAVYQWLESFSTEFFFLFASGDRYETLKSRASTFIGIAPQIRATDVFFNGGINAFSARRGISIGGISGRGYIVPGLNLKLAKEDEYEVRLTAAVLLSHVIPPTDPSSNVKPGRLYGVEVNVNAKYQLLSWLAPVIQIDFFKPGSFFKHEKINLPTALFQILVGVDIYLEGPGEE